MVANRTLETAQDLAAAIGGRALPLEGLEAALARVDIVVSQTGASEPILGKAMVERAMKVRHGRPLFLIDIAVPRDIEPEAGSVYNVFLYDIDDLGRVVTGNRERRAEAAEQALEIVQAETARFTKWFEGLEAVPTIVALRDRFDTVRAQETARLLAKLQHLPEHDRKLIEHYGETLVNKLLHGPSAQLRHLGGGDRGVQLASALRYLFRLDEAAPREREAAKPPAEPDAD
jgi:glutamyl-tRNA reductase